LKIRRSICFSSWFFGILGVHCKQPL